MRWEGNLCNTQGGQLNDNIIGVVFPHNVILHDFVLWAKICVVLCILEHNDHGNDNDSGNIIIVIIIISYRAPLPVVSKGHSLFVFRSQA